MKLEERLRKVQAAARADLQHLVNERETRIINKLVASYRGGTLTDAELHGGIAAISELRHMQQDAEHNYMNAESVFDQLQAGAQNAASQD